MLVERLKTQQAKLKENRRARLAMGRQQVITDLESRKRAFVAKVEPIFSN